MYLLRNKMKCGYCDKSVTSESGMSRNGTVVRYYKCSTRKKDSTKCHKAPIRKEILEQLIVDATVKVLDNPETIDLVADRVLEAHDKRLRDTAVINILEAERDRIRNALKKEPRLMIKLLVKEVILYDDKVEIYYNCIDKKRPDDLEHQAFCVYRQDYEVDPKELGLRHNMVGCKLVLEMYF